MVACQGILMITSDGIATRCRLQDCETGSEMGSSHRMAIYSQILWRTIGFGGTYFQTIMLVQWLKHAETCWNMLKRPVTSLSSLLCSHKQRICLQVAGSFDCSWSFATQRATDFAMENPRCYSVTIQMRQMASQEWCWATCAVFCHIPRMAISVISGRRLQPITYWIRQLAAEDEPLKAPSCPQSEEAAAYLWDLSNFWWLPSFRSGMTHDDDSWHNDS